MVPRAERGLWEGGESLGQLAVAQGEGGLKHTDCEVLQLGTVQTTKLWPVYLHLEKKCLDFFPFFLFFFELDL